MSIRKPMLIRSLILDNDSLAGGSYFAKNSSTQEKPDMPLEALDASVNLAIDGASSSASIKLAAGTKVDARAYIEMFTVQGSAGVFRTRSPRIAYGTGNTTIQLEHAINQMGDYIINDTFEKEMTLENAVKKVFEYYNKKEKKYWRYAVIQKPSDPDGVDAYNQKCVLSIDHDNCLEALQSIMEQYPYMYMTFSFDEFPWKVSFRNRPTLAEAQGRLSRNVKSAVVTRDDTDLTTRAYAEKKNGKSYSYSAATFYRNKYGIIERELQGDNDSDAALEQKVKTWIKRHKKPSYSISIDGIELSGITGEKLDKLTIGKLMTLALPDYNTVITEQITGVSFPSVYKQPMSCTVTLNQEEEKVIKYIKKAQQSARRASRSAQRVQTAAIIDASVANNVLTLTKGNGTKVNFSKAVSLKTAKWGSGTFTVEGTQTNKNTSTGKNETKTVLKTTTKLTSIELQSGKSPSRNGTYNLDIPLRVMYYSANSSNKKAATGYTQTVRVSAKTVWDSVTIKSIGLASNYSPLGDSAGDTRYQIFIEAKASNGKKKDDKLLTLASTKYAGNSKYCVNLKDGSDIIGRINIDSVYTAGWNAVTVSSIGLASNYSPLGDSAGDTRYQIFIEAKASNGAKKDDKMLTLASTKYAGNSKYCVNLKDGNDVIGRINIDSVYTAGWNAVMVSSIGLASNFSPLGNSDTRTNIYFQAVASNGAKKDDKLITLASTTYGGGYCVNVKDGSDVIGRIDIDSVYTAGVNSVTVTSIGLASNYSALGNNDTRTNIYFQAVASNGAKKDDKLITLASTTYGGGYCVNLKDGNSVIGRIDIDSVYTAGETAGKKAATVSISHGSVTTDSNYQKHVTYTAVNNSNTSNKAEVLFYLVKNGTKSQLRAGGTGGTSGTLIMEINNT